MFQVLLKLEMNSGLKAQLEKLSVSAAKEIELGGSDWTVNTVFVISSSAEIFAENPTLLVYVLEEKWEACSPYSSVKHPAEVSLKKGVGSLRLTAFSEPIFEENGQRGLIELHLDSSVSERLTGKDVNCKQKRQNKVSVT